MDFLLSIIIGTCSIFSVIAVTWLVTKYFCDKEVEQYKKDLQGITLFYDPKTPYSMIPEHIIKEYIPETSYVMNSESRYNLLQTCDDEYEKTRIQYDIHRQETVLGDPRCYNIETSHAVYSVRYGVPELIKNKDNHYKYLSTDKLNSICELLNDDIFLTLTKIMYYERKHIKEYIIENDSMVIEIKDGEFMVVKK